MQFYYKNYYNILMVTTKLIFITTNCNRVHFVFYDQDYKKFTIIKNKILVTIKPYTLFFTDH
jgi:hypothetical protein